MNEELKRIRSKDFTSIDQKLYENLSRADNLTSTLSHLSDFQRFLMEQISSLNHNSSGVKSTLIAKSIAKNFDDLKESLVKCSRLQIKPEKSLFANLKAQVQSLKKELSETKNEMKQQSNSIAIKSSEAIKDLMGHFVCRLQKEKREKDQLFIKCERLQKANAVLTEQNQKLKCAFKSRETSTQLEHSNQKPIHHQKVNTPIYCTTPLREVQRPNNFINKQAWKITKNQIAVANQASQQKRCSSLKRQTSNHQIPRKQHFQCFDKQNELLKAKGVVLQELKRGKSKQKIKLISMI